MNTAKYCIDCQHFKDQKAGLPVCLNGASIDLVLGQQFSTIECKKARSDAGDCGPSGTNWVAALPVSRNGIGNPIDSRANVLDDCVGTAINNRRSHELGDERGVFPSVSIAKQGIDVGNSSLHEGCGTVSSLPKDSFIY